MLLLDLVHFSVIGNCCVPKKINDCCNSVFFFFNVLLDIVHFPTLGNCCVPKSKGWQIKDVLSQAKDEKVCARAPLVSEGPEG